MYMRNSDINFNEYENKFFSIKRLRKNLKDYKNDKNNINLIIKLERFSVSKLKYRITIHANGDGTYNKMKNLQNSISQTPKINKNQIKELLSQIDNIDFFSLNGLDMKKVSSDKNKDLNKISVTFENDTKEIVFSNDKKRYSGLIEIGNFIDKITKSE